MNVRRIGIATLALVIGCSVIASSQTRASAPAPCANSIAGELRIQARVVPHTAGHNRLGPRYYIRDVRIVDPWSFLRREDQEVDDAIAKLKGQPLDTADVNSVFNLIIQRRLPNAGFGYGEVRFENCSSDQVDVVFRLFTALVSPREVSTYEFRQRLNNEPRESSNIEDKRKVRIVPIAGYDEPKKPFAGARLLGKFAGSPGSIDSVSFEALGPESLRSGSGEVNGSFNFPDGVISEVEWRAKYDYSSTDTDQSSLNSGRASFQATATTRPLKGIVFRAGTLLEAGNQQSDFLASSLDARTLASSAYSTAKFYGGLTLDRRRQALKASYGIAFGSIGSGLHGDWRKHIGDVAHEFWVPLGHHRRIEVQQQATAGTVQIMRAVPLRSLFFGGNREEVFIPGDSWTIRSNPVIRSIPANRFYETRDGAGAKRFIAYNSNVAITLWRKPLVPSDLATDPEFQRKKNAAIGDAQSALEVVYESEDPNFAKAREVLPTIGKKLNVLRIAVSTTPSPEDCIDKIDSAAAVIDPAMKYEAVRAYGYVIELLPDGGDALVDVVSVCKSGATDPSVIAAADDLDRSRTDLETAFGAIDQAAATRKAKNDLAPVTRTLDTIIEDLNISSLSPLFVFDAARIGPESAGRYSGTRYGVGGGVRFSLVDTVSLSVGYAANLHRRPEESRGAFFFSFSNRSLFRW
jgi:hypothetical protein